MPDYASMPVQLVSTRPTPAPNSPAGDPPLGGCSTPHRLGNSLGNPPRARVRLPCSLDLRSPLALLFRSLTDRDAAAHSGPRFASHRVGASAERLWDRTMLFRYGG